MRIAGIRVGDTMVWIDAGDHAIAVLDHATILIDGEEQTGVVVVTPEQFIRAQQANAGVLVATHRPVRADQRCADLPGADLPPLGSTLTAGQHTGAVIAIDAVRRVVTLDVDGQQVEVSV